MEVEAVTIKGTQYTLVQNTGQLAYAKNFLLAHGYGDVAVTPPIIMAFREDSLIGVLATHDQDEALIAGPLAVDTEGGRRAIFIALRLIEVYERYLTLHGIPGYYFYVDKFNTQWLDNIKEVLNLEPYHIDKNYAWFKRDLEWAAAQK